MNAVYVISSVVIFLLLLPLLVLVVLTLGPAAFVFLLIATLGLPIALATGALTHHNRH